MPVSASWGWDANQVFCASTDLKTGFLVDVEMDDDGGPARSYLDRWPTASRPS